MPCGPGSMAESAASPAPRPIVRLPQSQGTQHSERQDNPRAGAQLQLAHIHRAFGVAGTSRVAIEDISLEVSPGEFLSIVGPSGCGKSTLLQIAAGLLPPTAGQVLLNGRAVTSPPDHLVYLFQQYSRSLFPWRTALDNVAFAVEHKTSSRSQARKHSRRYLDMVALGELRPSLPVAALGWHAAARGHCPRPCRGAARTTPG